MQNLIMFHLLYIFVLKSQKDKDPVVQSVAENATDMILLLNTGLGELWILEPVEYIIFPM